MGKEEENSELSSILDIDINQFLGGTTDPQERATEPVDVEGTNIEPNDPTKSVKTQNNTLDVNNILEGSLKKPEEGPEKKVEGVNSEKLGNPSDPQNTNNTSSSLTFSFYQDLLDRGVISIKKNEDEFKKLAEENNGDEYEALNRLIEDELLSEKEAIYKELDEDVQTYFKLRDSGLNSEQAGKLVSTQFQLDRLTEQELSENEDIQKVLMTQYYKKTTKLSDEDIAEEIQTKFDTGKNVEFSKKAHTNLLKLNSEEIKTANERAEQLKQQQLQSQAEQRQNVIDSIEKINELFPDLKLNKNQKQDLQDMILKPVGKDPKGNPVNAIWAEFFKDPVKFQVAVAAQIKNGTLYGKPITNSKTGEQKAISKFKEQLNRMNSSPSDEGIGKIPGSGYTTSSGNIYEQTDAKARELEELFKRN